MPADKTSSLPVSHSLRRRRRRAIWGAVWAVYAVVAVWFLAVWQPTIGGLTIHLASLPRTDAFQVFPIHSNGYASEDASPLVTTRLSRTPVAVRLPLTLSDMTRRVRFDIGQGNIPGEPPLRYTINAVSWDACLGPVHVPLVRWTGARLARTARPLHSIASLSVDGDALVVRTLGRDPYLDTAVNVQALRDNASPTARMLARLVAAGIWTVIFLAAVFYRRVGQALAPLINGVGELIATRRVDRLIYPPGFFSANWRWLTGGVVLLVAANLARSWSALVVPGLYIEDTTHYFNFFYGAEHPFGYVFEHINSYLAPGTRTVAWLVAFLDVRIQPMAYLVFSVSLATCAVAAVTFTGLFRNRWFLLLVPVVVGLSGINHIFFYNTLTEQIYVAILLLLVLLLVPAPRTGSKLAALTVVAMLLVWFGPYSVVAIPVSLLLIALFGDARKNVMLAAVIASALAYFATVETGTAQLTTGLSMTRMTHMLSVLFEQVFLLDLGGEVTVSKVLLFFVVFSAAVWPLRNDRLYLKLAIVLLGIVLFSLAPYFLSTKYMAGRVWPVHTVTATFFWLVFVLFTAERWAERLALRPAAMAVSVAVILALVSYDNVRHADKRQVDGVLEATARSTLPRYLETIHYYEQQELARDNQFVILQLPTGPRVIVGVRGRSAEQLTASHPRTRVGREFIVGPPQDAALDTRDDRR